MNTACRNRKTPPSVFPEASLTVETALIMPAAIFTILMAVYLAAHVHNRAFLYSSAAEQAISGHEQESPFLFASGEISVSRSDDRNRRSVSMSCGTMHYSGQTLWSVSEEAVYKKYRPVEMIRKLKAAKQILDP